jgi:hypothetical protein
MTADLCRTGVTVCGLMLLALTSRGDHLAPDRHSRRNR